MGARENQADDLELARAMLDRLTQLFDDELTPAHVVEKLPGRIKELREDIRALEMLKHDMESRPRVVRELPVAPDSAAVFKTIMGENHG